MKDILNRQTYKGRGRPRNSDYMTLVEAQRWLNQLYNNYLDYQELQFKNMKKDTIIIHSIEWHWDIKNLPNTHDGKKKDCKKCKKSVLKGGKKT